MPLLEVTKLTVPDTLAPFAGELIVSEAAGVGVEVGVGIAAALVVRVATINRIVVAMRR